GMLPSLHEVDVHYGDSSWILNEQSHSKISAWILPSAEATIIKTLLQILFNYSFPPVLLENAFGHLDRETLMCFATC
ncbi:hypothetical protein L7F22_032231, partial [Adiantum nelumboides]|nr:hypothetical protein [Adiantum nelumboides]